MQELQIGSLSKSELKRLIIEAITEERALHQSRVHANEQQRAKASARSPESKILWLLSKRRGKPTTSSDVLKSTRLSSVEIADAMQKLIEKGDVEATKTPAKTKPITYYSIKNTKAAQAN